MNAGELIIKTELDTKSFEAQIKKTEKELDELIRWQEKYSKLYAKTGREATKDLIEDYEIKIEKAKNKLVSLKEKQDLLDNPPKDTINWAEDFGKNLQQSIRHISRLILGIFGIRGAYMAVRSAMNTILANDDQLSADITYMKNVIAFMLEPVVRKIVGWFKQLMYYVGYIAKAWFGVNIYANASAKAIDAGAKKAKEMKKQLAGFDEMNVLSDSSGGEENVAPSFDLGNMEDMPIPSWLQWIADHKDEVIAGLAGIASALVLVKLGVHPLMALGIGLAIDGIIRGLADIKAFMEDPTWENFKKVLGDLAEVLLGVALAMAVVNAQNPITWILIAIALIILVTTTIVDNWDKIKETLGKVGNWVKENIIDKVQGFFHNFYKGLGDGFTNIVGKIKDKFSTIVGFFKGIISNVLGVFGTLGAKAGDVIGGAFKGVVNGVLGFIEGFLNTPIRTINSLIKTINKIPGISIGTLGLINLPRLAKGGIINMPGRGVPVGSAIGGERGAEGVIPLTDSQQMALLGEAIGKYININATVPVYVGNRQIAREIRKIEAENDFAYNG